MCESSEDLLDQAEWDGAAGESRKLLLSDLSRKFYLPTSLGSKVFC